MPRPASVAVAWPAARAYSRRVPEATVRYRVIQQHFGEFLAQVEAGERGGRLPAFVKDEFEAYLGCGLLSRGCLPVRCAQCGDEMAVAFSCKGRFCPSGGGRRLTELAAHLVDRVIADVSVWQWVLSLPWSLRYQLAFDAGLWPPPAFGLWPRPACSPRGQGCRRRGTGLSAAAGHHSSAGLDSGGRDLGSGQEGRRRGWRLRKGVWNS